MASLTITRLNVIVEDVTTGSDAPAAHDLHVLEDFHLFFHQGGGYRDATPLAVVGGGTINAVL